MTRHNHILTCLILAVAFLAGGLASPALAQYEGPPPDDVYNPGVAARMAYSDMKAADAALTATVNSLTAAWYNSDYIVGLRAASARAKYQADAIDAQIKASLPDAGAYQRAAADAIRLQAELDAMRSTGWASQGRITRLAQDILAAQTAQGRVERAAERVNPAWVAADAAYRRAQAALEAERKIFADGVRQDPAYRAAQSAYARAVARDSQNEAAYARFLAERADTAVAQAKAAFQASYY